MSQINSCKWTANKDALVNAFLDHTIFASVTEIYINIKGILYYFKVPAVLQTITFNTLLMSTGTV